MWLARKNNGLLFLHSTKPQFVNEEWKSLSCMAIDEDKFPDITFENNPIKIEINYIV